MQVNDSNRGRNRTIVLAIVCFLLQVMIAPHIAMGNGRINFALVFAGVYALSAGGRDAVVAGFTAGLLFDLTSTGPIGLMAALLTLLAFALGIEERNRFADGFVACLTSFGVASLLVLIAYHLTANMLGSTEPLFDLLIQRVLPTYALTFVVFLAFAFVQVRGAAKGHGLSKSPTSSSKRGSHYDVSNL